MERHVFVAKYPTLWHLADGDAWPSIKSHGLLSTQRLVGMAHVSAPDDFLRSRRSGPYPLTGDDGLQAVIRDHDPLMEDALASALTDGMNVGDWIRLLNSMVFFAPSREVLAPMVAKYVQDAPVTLIGLRTRTVLNRYDSLVRLARINTGNLQRKPTPRGRRTFLPVEQFSGVVKEITVLGEITDAADHVVVAERVFEDGTVENLLV